MEMGWPRPVWIPISPWNVQTTLPQINPVVLSGGGFNAVDGVGVDVSCACPAARCPPPSSIRAIRRGAGKSFVQAFNPPFVPFQRQRSVAAFVLK